MATLKLFEGIEDFLLENATTVKDNYLVFRQFLNLLGQLSQDKQEFYKLFTIVENETPEIFCLKTQQHLLLIPIKQKISPKAYEILRTEIEKSIIAGVELLGERKLVLKIVKDCNSQFTVIKDRLLYECTKTKNVSISEGRLQIPSPKDIEEITRMEVSYHKEEYREKSNCTFENTVELVRKKFNDQSLLLWSDHKEIVSLINAKIEGDLFYIYHIYTKPSKRRRGFGSNLLHTVASRIIDAEKVKAGLVSQRLDEATNKIFIKIGFLPIYEMLDIEIL